MTKSMVTAILPSKRAAVGLCLLALALALAATALAAKAPPAKNPRTAGTAPAPASAAKPPPGTLLDEVVAVVNNKPILESSLDEEMQRVGSALQAQGTPIPPENVFRHQVIEHLITQNLELQAAQQQGVQVSDDQVNQALSDIAQRNGMSLAQLPQALAAQGQSYAAFRRMIRDQITIHQLEQQEVAANIDVSPAEIDDYLQTESNGQGSNSEYHIAQILLAFPSNPTPAQVKQTLAKAQGIEAQLRKGANFAATAVAQSAGPHALQGGEIGWLKAADLPTLFSDVVPGLKEGEVSDPIEGPDGYHIVKLLSKRSSASKSVKTEYDVEHILIRPNPVRDMAQSKALAEKIRGQIESGSLSFADAAKQYSDDPNSAGGGGSLGWETLDQLPPAFAKAVEKLPVNTLSQPVRTQYGWHLIEVTGKRQRNESAEEKRHDAYQAIFQRKLADQLAEFKRTLRDQAYIHILNPADAGNGSDSDSAGDAGGR